MMNKNDQQDVNSEQIEQILQAIEHAQQYLKQRDLQLAIQHQRLEEYNRQLDEEIKQNEEAYKKTNRHIKIALGIFYLALFSMLVLLIWAVRHIA